MNKSVKGTLTEANLLKSFAGESQAKNRYTFFSEVAEKRGVRTDSGHILRDRFARRDARETFLQSFGMRNVGDHCRVSCRGYFGHGQ